MQAQHPEYTRLTTLVILTQAEADAVRAAIAQHAAPPAQVAA